MPINKEVPNNEALKSSGKIDDAVKFWMQSKQNENPEKTITFTDTDEDMVNNPSHYQSLDSSINIDAITCMRAAFGKYEVAVFCKLNAFKYIYRASSKGGNQDIDKALWYLNKYKELGGEDQ